jgi:vanillate O-demethylase monooxygenase subunit
MFLPADNSKHRNPVPRDTDIRPSDWLVLSGFWHPVAFAHEVGVAPAKARLLDVDLVIYRTSAGISVARDICPHRGTRLSRGGIIDDMLVCPMHGLHFDGAGQCRKIPSIADPNVHIPPSFRLNSVMSEVRYGIVWACLSGEPIWPLPVWSGIENPDFTKLYFPVESWAAGAPWHVENFNDLAHVPWIHDGTFGGHTGAPVPRYEVLHTDYGMTFHVPYTEGGNRFPDGVRAENRDVIYRYELTFPFTTLLRVEPTESDYILFYADVASPVSAHESRIFQVSTDTTGDPDAPLWLKDTLMINNEDRPVVEAQYPKDLPLDVREEMHIPADRMSIEYRRALVSKFGLGAPVSN